MYKPLRVPFWVRPIESVIPQKWSCSMCTWEGEDPRFFADPHQNKYVLRDPVPHPTCPECGSHRFYIFTEPLPEKLFKNSR